MADKPETFPSPIEPDDEEDEPKSTLSPEVADREAKKAIEEIEEEVEREHPAKRASMPHVVHEGERQSFLDKAWERQYAIEARLKSVGHGRYSRVIKMARKPEHEEYVKASQITGLGIVVIGFVGFLIYLLTTWLWHVLRIK